MAAGKAARAAVKVEVAVAMVRVEDPYLLKQHEQFHTQY
jgi:hypothetical protein